MNRENLKIGVGSYAFRYAIGIPNCMPEKPMTPLEFIDAASDLGFNTIQLCENIKYAGYETNLIRSFAQRAKNRKLIVELGMKGLTYDNLKKHIELAKIFESDFIRIAIDNLANDYEQTVGMAIETLSSLIDECKKNKIAIGLENHFDLPTPYIVKILETVNDPCVGAVYDTTNHIGFIEHPEDTLELLLPFVKSVHIKDYQIKKGEACTIISGQILGEGQLNAAKILKTVLAANPKASVIMEMLIRRRDGISDEQVVREEKMQIEKNTQNLFRLLDSL